MATILALYNTPADPSKFDEYYLGIHTPIAKRMPGLQSFEVNKGPVTALVGTPYYQVARLTFATMADAQAALASAEGQAAVADVPNFAQAGVTLLLFYTIER